MTIKQFALVATLTTLAAVAQASAAGAATYTSVGGYLSGHTVQNSCTASACSYSFSGKVSSGTLSGSRYKGTVSITKDPSNCGVMSGGLKFYNSNSANILQLKYRPTSIACLSGTPGDSRAVLVVTAFLVPSTTASAQKGTFAGTNGGEMFLSFVSDPWEAGPNAGGTASGVLRS